MKELELAKLLEKKTTKIPKSIIKKIDSVQKFNKLLSKKYGINPLKFDTNIVKNASPADEILKDIEVLKKEFDNVEIDIEDETISATTDRIVLNKIDLGPFKIKLYLGQNYIECEALDPNPAEENESIYHPNVECTDICLGDASAAIDAAFKTNRIYDIFTLVDTVLKTGDQSSNPHIPIDSWTIVHCSGCDSRSYTECCGKDYCEDCLNYCQYCDYPYCHKCEKVCTECKDTYCSNCINNDDKCPNCRRKTKD